MHRPLAVWTFGLVLALLVLGPALAPGALLNLDLVLTPDIPVPAGVWGLGPELPRRVPLFVPMAWLSTVLDGALVGKALMVGVIAVAFAGVYRLTSGAPVVSRVGAGLVYAAGPFLATRLAVGHLGTALATAVLPWALPTLLRPGDSLRRTFLWSLALGLCGINGGLLAVLILAVALAADRGRRLLAVAGVALLGQLPWLVPGAVVLAQGVNPAGSAAFDTRIGGPVGLLRLTAGEGFWIADFDVGRGGIAIPIVGAVLLALAVLGQRLLPAGWANRAAVVAVAGLLIAAGSGLPVVDGVYGWFADTPIGAPLREGHRVLALFLVWLVTAAAQGTARVGRQPEVGALVLLGAALAVLGPSLWAFGGQLEPVRLPTEWAAARDAVAADPGPVLAVPWSQYIRPTLIDGRLVHHPAPFALGGDVLLPSGRGRLDGPNERADPRQTPAGAIVDDLAAGAEAAPTTEPLGIRWIVVVTTPQRDFSDLVLDPTLERQVAGETLELYRVQGAPGVAVDDNQRDVAIDTVVGPYARLPASGAVTWHRPGADGWLRGLTLAGTTADGNVRLPAGRGPVWYWPTLLVLAADVVVVGAAAWAVYGCYRRRRVLPCPGQHTA